MKKCNVYLIAHLFLFIPLLAAYQQPSRIVSDSTVVTYVHSEGSGNIAVRVEIPKTPRYTEGAPVAVEVSTWFVWSNGFHRVNDTRRIGAVTVSYMWPQHVDPKTGAVSEGVYDYGGPLSLKVLKDVIQFASGQKTDIYSNLIQSYIPYTLLISNLGLFASSHAGVMGTNVLAYYGIELPNVKYFIGRENPTRDEMYPLELGHFSDNRNPNHNGFFNEANYSLDTVDVDYSTVGWYKPHPDSTGRPWFAAKDTIPEHILHPTIVPKLYNKRSYSRAVTRALLVNGALTLNNWPHDLLKPAEADSLWHFRTAVHNYIKFPAQVPNLKVMLVFSRDDHVQTSRTKVHIRQAWDGFHKTAGLWVRMNPDRSYMRSLDSNYGAAFPDNAANKEPIDWIHIRDWGFPADKNTRDHTWLASVAEMADRVQYDRWDNNLTDVFHEVLIDPSATSISNHLEIDLSAWSLLPNYPNPFNSETVISYQVSERSHVQISVYNILGEKIKVLIDNTKEPGNHHIHWDASNFSSGYYLFVMQIGEITQVKKGLLIR